MNNKLKSFVIKPKMLKIDWFCLVLFFTMGFSYLFAQLYLQSAGLFVASLLYLCGVRWADRYGLNIHIFGIDRNNLFKLDDGTKVKYFIGSGIDEAALYLDSTDLDYDKTKIENLGQVEKFN